MLTQAITPIWPPAYACSIHRNGAIPAFVANPAVPPEAVDRLARSFSRRAIAPGFARSPLSY